MEIPLVKKESKNIFYIPTKWSDKEEMFLLEEIQKNDDFEKIVRKNNISIDDIYFHRNEIAYKMYKKNIAIDEIIKKTKLTRQELDKIIESKKLCCSCS
jgi:hypothetical protein